MACLIMSYQLLFALEFAELELPRFAAVA